MHVLANTHKVIKYVTLKSKTSFRNSEGGSKFWDKKKSESGGKGFQHLSLVCRIIVRFITVYLTAGWMEGWMDGKVERWMVDLLPNFEILCLVACCTKRCCACVRAIPRADVRSGNEVPPAEGGVREKVKSGEAGLQRAEAAERSGCGLQKMRGTWSPRAAGMTGTCRRFCGSLNRESHSGGLRG